MLGGRSFIRLVCRRRRVSHRLSSPAASRAEPSGNAFTRTRTPQRRLVTADNPRVSCDTLIRDDGALFAVLASHAAEQLTIKPALPGGGELTSLGGKETAEGVELGPFGITVLRKPSHGRCDRQQGSDVAA